MELKRYVLVMSNNYKNKFKDEIDLIDTKDNLLQEKLSEYKHEAETGYKRWYGYTTRKMRKNAKETYLAYNNGGRYRDENVDIIGKITKTSDNILDLVEVGDLVELKGNDMFYVTSINSDYFMNNNDGVNRGSSHIVAIYKRQTNGDYKKYEVLAWVYM